MGLGMSFAGLKLIKNRYYLGPLTLNPVMSLVVQHTTSQRVLTPIPNPLLCFHFFFFVFVLQEQYEEAKKQ